MTMTTDKLRSMVKKWQTLIEANCDVKTTDGYLLRLFCIGFTKRRPNQVKKTSYAQTQQIKRIRRKMITHITKEVVGADMKGVSFRCSNRGIKSLDGADSLSKSRHFCIQLLSHVSILLVCCGMLVLLCVFVERKDFLRLLGIYRCFGILMLRSNCAHSKSLLVANFFATLSWMTLQKVKTFLRSCTFKS